MKYVNKVLCTLILLACAFGCGGGQKKAGSGLIDSRYS